MGVKLEAEDIAVNEAVARITGLSKKFFTETAAPDEESFMDAGPSPLDDLNAQFGATVEAVEELMPRGDNADYQPNMPDPGKRLPPKPKAQNSQAQVAPKQRMPAKKPTGDMYGADETDSNPETITPKKTAENRMYKTIEKRLPNNQTKMESFVAEYIGSLDEFNYWSGLPMNEDSHVAHSGDVPTAGVNKDNKTKAGLPGLQGQALQDIEPEDGPPGDEDGTDKEMTLDQTIAMLKKEGYDGEELWSSFLEARGLTVELFAQLVDEAMESDDVDEMDALLAVEGLFVAELPKLLPEGLMDMFRKKKAPEMPAATQAKDVIKKHGMSAVRAANSRGMSVEKMGKTKPMPTSVAQAQREIGSAKSLVRKESKEVRFSVTNEELEDMTVRPRDYRKLHPMGSMMTKYGLDEGKFWIAKATAKNKGALHKKLGVPMGKKIPAKKLAAAAHSKNPKERKEVNLAKTLKKLHKK